jgi:hypothetical protein
MAYATSEDVSVRWARTPSDEEAALIQVRLEDVERMIRKRIPTLDALITAGDIVEDDLIQIEADSVLRLVRNPEGYVSESDGNYTYQFKQSTSAGTLEILPEEWALLGVRASGVLFSLVPYQLPGE